MSAAETPSHASERGGQPARAGDPGHGEPEHIQLAVAACQGGAGDDGGDGGDGFRLLYSTYFPAVRGFFSKRLASADLGLDLTQETFIRVYKGIEGYRGDGPFGAWVFRIAWNVLRRHLATKSVSELEKKSVSLDDPDSRLSGSTLAATPAAAAGDSGAFAKALRGERRQILRRAIADLPAQRRRCMVLWAYHELTYDQIATVMRLSIGTVKAHLAQARRQLVQRVAPNESPPEHQPDERN